MARSVSRTSGYVNVHRVLEGQSGRSRSEQLRIVFSGIVFSGLGFCFFSVSSASS